MSLSIGIIGLPNVGKSTVFNALTGSQNAEVANYPFCTIQPNRAIVPLKDPRLDKLRLLTGVKEIIYATVEFLDIAGLVKGASEGEGLGNQFLSHVRNSDALIHVVRGFDDPNVIHVHGALNPKDDIEVIHVELALSDMAQLDRKITKLVSDIKGDRSLLPLLELAKDLRRHLASGNMVRSYANQNTESFKQLVKELRFLTAKPFIFAINVDETGLSSPSPDLEAVKFISEQLNSPVITLCAKLEEEMVDMTLDEQREFLGLVGAESSGLDQVVKKSFEALNLISFFTKNENEVRAWQIPAGTCAPSAAGQIHTDFERGFIRAEVVSFDIFNQLESDAAVRASGLMRSEGREYIIQDGDVVFFRFNV